MMKELPPLRFLAIWLWLVLLAAAPVLFGIAKIVAITQDWACFMALRCPRSSMRFGDCFYMDSRMLSPWLRLCMGFAVLFIATTPFVYAIFNCSICFKHAQLLQ